MALEAAVARVRAARRGALVLAALAAAFASVVALFDPAVIAWSAAQLLRAAAPWRLAAPARWERWAWEKWEAGASLTYKKPLRVRRLHVGDRPADLDAPFLMRGLLNSTRADGDFSNLDWLLNQANVRESVLTSSTDETVAPDRPGQLSEIVRSILSGGRPILSTQLLFTHVPTFLAERRVLDPLMPLFGKNFSGETWLGSTFKVPVHVGRGSSETEAAHSELLTEPGVQHEAIPMVAHANKFRVRIITGR